MKAKKRLYSVIVGYETLFAMDEFENPEQILKRHIDEITKNVEVGECRGIFEEQEIENLDDLGNLTDTWNPQTGSPFTMDDDERVIVDYLTESEKDLGVMGCPFCGEDDPEMFKISETGDQYINQIECCSCGARSSEGDSIKEVVDQWNQIFGKNMLTGMPGGDIMLSYSEEPEETGET